MTSTLEGLIDILADLRAEENRILGKPRQRPVIKVPTSRLATVQSQIRAIHTAIDREGASYADLDELALQWAYRIDKLYQVEHIGGAMPRIDKVQAEIRELLRRLKP